MNKPNDDVKKDKIQGQITKKEKPRLIFVGSDQLMIKRVQKFSQDNKMLFQHYSEEDWATLEEIDQYIQEEELSKQIVTLPVGKANIHSLSEMEADTIKRVLKHVNGNMAKAARNLKIARATLYRKIEMYGLNLKKQREKEFQSQSKTIKKAA